ncbi:MAG: hypothetical protein UV57_C0030G0008 [Parcubacteria group bacterium GW2011_GWD2_43_10]|nr:MAG: hypothetical protein UV57_C0030G0008 [Parcubacteria group bacterium GW2011_GWD2_43_10]
MRKTDIIAEEEKAILKIVAEDPKATRRALAESLGLTEQAIQRRLDKLVQDGRLVRKGPKKGGHWEVL